MVFRKSFIFLLIICATLSIAGTMQAQTINPYNQRDDTYRLLGLKRARDAFQVARAEFNRRQELFKRGHITQADLEQARSIYSEAEVNYQQSLLAVLFEEQFVSIDEAVKYYDERGAKHVRLTLVNTSGGTAEFQKLLNIDDELFRSLQPDRINNVYVSILNDDGAIVSRPYEAKIDELRFGTPVTLDFLLLQDMDVATVSIIYGNGSQRSMKIFLEKDATVDRVAVQSEQFSQEVELGTTASFDLTLELYSGTTNTFALEVVNLPLQISRSFRDASGKIRLSQVKFTESTNTKRAELEISLPDRPSSEVVMDQPITFYALVLPRSRLKELPDLHNRDWTEAELSALDVGFVKLELLPRGKGELMVRSQQLFHSILSDETATMAIEVLNEGTHSLSNVEVKLDLPLNWTKTISPAVIPILEINEDQRIELSFTPPESIAPGKYQVRIRTRGLSNNEPVLGEDKTVTIEIRSQTSLFGTISIVMLVLTLVGGMVMYGVRLSKR